jgi:hypothetical protein
VRRAVLVIALLSVFSFPVLAKGKGQDPSARREVVQVPADSSDTQKQIGHPTFTVYAGVPNDLHFGKSLALPSVYSVGGLWKVGITATVFSVGEPPTGDDPGNIASAWDQDWIHTSKSQNPFYVALPYNDIEGGHTKPEARSIIPWFNEAFVRDGQSVLKDKWVAIRKGPRVCYAQWEDVGPYETDHWQYVFGNDRPRPNHNHDAGIDVSPAVRDFLGMCGMDSCDWRFVDHREIPQGPWRTGPNDVLEAELYSR